MEEKRRAPWWLSHKPVVTVDYEENDAIAGDAKFLSLGKATWNSEDFSAKIWRWAENGERWSRESEEMPLWRVLDLATLIVATINDKDSRLEEFIQDPETIGGLREYLTENMELFAPRLKELVRLLSANNLNDKPFDIPNIFNFATSELSQDAMFAWLIKWADDVYKEKDPKICLLGKSFVSLMTGIPVSEIHTIRVGRQWCNIDLWVEINQDSFLTIEDKTGTSIHDDQLQKYKQIVEKEYDGKRDKLFYAYVKTGNEPLSVLKKIKTQGYKTVSRQNLLSILDEYKGNNSIIIDFRKHLKDIEIATNDFKSLPVAEWDWYAWQGFYQELEDRLDIDSWDYVPNPSGGFLGIWWYFKSFEDGEMYLQIEQGKLCFKIYYEGEQNRSGVRWRYYSTLMKIKGDDYPEIKKPDRFGAGTYMTIAIVCPEDLYGLNVVDIDKVVKKLKCYQELVDKCCDIEI